MAGNPGSQVTGMLNIPEDIRLAIGHLALKNVKLAQAVMELWLDYAKLHGKEEAWLRWLKSGTLDDADYDKVFGDG